MQENSIILTTQEQEVYDQFPDQMHVRFIHGFKDSWTQGNWHLLCSRNSKL